ncbi:nucleotidyltransferase domain-containing protein [Dehalococcoidia bacterium]|nr:nucleotidyltransferase domain-containing protein [Dehalococcoidia bacterium]
MNHEMSERLRRISERLKKECHAGKVILYGSYVTGEATEDSDNVSRGELQWLEPTAKSPPLNR